MRIIQSVGIVSNPTKDHEFTILKKIISVFEEVQIQVYITSKLDDTKYSNLHIVEDFPNEIEALIVVGGDGTYLQASPIAFKKDIPIIGVNLGHQGYLTELEISSINLLKNLSVGEYEIQNRSVIEASIHVNDQTIQKDCIFNEISINRIPDLGISDLLLKDSFGNTIPYHGDGVIVSTSAGSTGYNFSAGGPIIDTHLEVLCCTPVCPHSMFNRSILLDGNSQITFENISRRNEPVHLSFDGMNSFKLNKGDYVTIQLSQKKLKTLILESNPMIRTLKRKMLEAELKDYSQEG